MMHGVAVCGPAVNAHGPYPNYLAGQGPGKVVN